MRGVTEYTEIAYAEGEAAVSVERPFRVTVVPAALLRL